MKCVIPCGGQSTRMGKNKCLVELNGKTLLQHVVEFWQELGIWEFIFIVGGDSRGSTIGCITSMNITSTTIKDRGNRLNLASAILLAEEEIEDNFILALGDCLNVGKFEPTWRGVRFGVGTWLTSNLEEINKNYLTLRRPDRPIAALVEKPNLSTPFSRWCGMGTFFLPKRIFTYMRQTSQDPKATSVDLTEAINIAILDGETVEAVEFTGEYINVTYPEDVKRAKKLLNIA